MNVLLVSFLNQTDPSGVVTYYQSLANELAERKLTVKVLTSTSAPTGWKKILGGLRRMASLFGKNGQILYYEFAHFTALYFAARKVRNESFSVIHAQDVVTGMAAYLALGKSVPLVLTCHYNDDPITEKKELFQCQKAPLIWLENWYRYLFASVKNYVFVSHYSFRKSMHLLPIKINKKIIYNSVNIDVSRFAIQTNQSGKLIISNVGYLDERKNQKLLILIAQELYRRDIKNFTIWLIGDGPQRAEYEQLVKKYSLTDQVKFYGRQPTPWQLVAKSDLYIHTALNDNCPYAIIEAMAVKIPVLALPVGGIPELLPVHAGQLQSTSIQEITDQVLAYFDKDARRKLASLQANHADNQLNHQLAVNKLLDFYKETIENA